MPDRASRYVTLKAPGTGIGKDTSNPGGGVSCLLGSAVRITGGFGGWDIVSRPRRTAMTLWNGFDPITLELPLLIRTDNPNSYEAGKRIEADCITLGMLAGRGEPAPEPQKRNGQIRKVTVKKGDTYAKIANANKVDLSDLLQLNNIRDPAKITRGDKLSLPEAKDREPFGQPPVITIVSDGSLVPYNELEWGDDDSLERKQWVIQDIDWADDTPNGVMRNIYGDRVLQKATVTVIQYVAPQVAATKTAPWRRNKTKKRTSKPKSKK